MASTPEALAAQWRRTLPRQREIVRFRWRSEAGRLSVAGSGAARIAPPDSLRVDMAASLGVGRSAVIIAGEVVQAEPPEVVDLIVPDRFALWLAFGIMRPPEAVRVERLDDGARRYWRTTDAAGRVTTFELRGDTLMRVSREEGGRISQQLRLTRGSGGGVARARLDDYARGVRFAMDVTGREPSEAFPDAIWRLR